MDRATWAGKSRQIRCGVHVRSMAAVSMVERSEGEVEAATGVGLRGLPWPQSNLPPVADDSPSTRRPR